MSADLPLPESTAHTPTTSVRLTGRMLNFMRLSIGGNDVPAILAQVADKFARLPKDGMPVVLACQDRLNLVALQQGLWELGLQPIGIVTGVLDEQARGLNLAIFPADGKRIDGQAVTKTAAPAANTMPEPPAEPPTAATAPTTAPTASQPVSQPTVPEGGDTEPVLPPQAVFKPRLHRQILRSGQSLSHLGGDLILTESVNAGAEAITDCNLHVYGKGEGRLVAGATGDMNAKIFCLRFNPSLVSVAGTYCLKENIPAEYLNQAVIVSYQEPVGLVFSLMNP